MPTKEYIDVDPEQEYIFKPQEDPDIPDVRLACSDCNLVHDIYLKIVDGKKICFSLETNEEETEKLRRLT